MTTPPPRVQVFAVIRFDRQFSEPSSSITVKEILPSLEEAKAEVERLNRLNGDQDTVYFWQTTRFFPNGRARKE